MNRQKPDGARRRRGEIEPFGGSRHRMTKQRRQVIEALRSARRYVTAKELYERLRASRKRFGLATVYRTLEALRELGWVAAAAQHHGEAAYLWCTSEHHHHAVCRRCGRVDDVPCKALPNYEKILSRGLGFALTDHQLEFYGVCAHCS
jgi:Fur family transcriptional regulator, ferric uptake regulator